MVNKDSFLDYEGYAKWKRGLNDWGDFLALTTLESKEIALQLKVSGINLKNSRVLELGFGSGKILKYLLNMGCDVDGVEIQEEMLEIAKKNGIKAYKNILQTDGRYDVILGFDVLEHMSTLQLKEFFEQASTRLTKGGKMIFRFPNADSYAGLAAQNGDFTHISSIGFLKLKQLIEPYGLILESFSGRVDFPVRKIRNLILKILRWPFVRIIGFGCPYFFSGSVVAVIKHKEP